MLHMDLALSQRITRHNLHTCDQYYEAFRLVYPAADSRRQRIGDGQALYLGAIDYGTTWGLGMYEPVTAEILAELEAFFQDAGMTPQLEVFPTAHESLLRELAPRGYQVQSFVQQLVRPLVQGEELPRLPPGVLVKRVQADDRRLWAQTVQQGFWWEDDMALDEPCIMMANAARPGMGLYLAYVDGQPAGGGALSIHEGMASCFQTSVRPRFRGRGVQTALLRARLEDAAASGCDLATISAEVGSGSMRNAERAGFRSAYTRIQMEKPVEGACHEER